jgi:hypothetical protein
MTHSGSQSENVSYTKNSAHHIEFCEYSPSLEDCVPGVSMHYSKGLPDLLFTTLGHTCSWRGTRRSRGKSTHPPEEESSPSRKLAVFTALRLEAPIEFKLWLS